MCCVRPTCGIAEIPVLVAGGQREQDREVLVYVGVMLGDVILGLVQPVGNSINLKPKSAQCLVDVVIVVNARVAAQSLCETREGRKVWHASNVALLGDGVMRLNFSDTLAHLVRKADHRLVLDALHRDVKPSTKIMLVRVVSVCVDSVTFSSKTEPAKDAEADDPKSIVYLVGTAATGERAIASEIIVDAWAGATSPSVSSLVPFTDTPSEPIKNETTPCGRGTRARSCSASMSTPLTANSARDKACAATSEDTSAAECGELNITGVGNSRKPAISSTVD
eukprot:CAMPEP_0198567520 /NCGR_PEP_ID=MMETSP1462-20131121/104907_1 /TAXON_ID=1333877 /ORGANISM="Brandtodinium nutriculum, Strain RCC3387" /LENGTH=279 /DNA_ID=CAMNT_0044298565 /DNA_START=122 /DNA_END=962 /DNA_ORIENTATION=+